MPRFYFDVTDAKGFQRDDIGTELKGFEEARQQAQVLLPNIARDELPDGELHQVVCDVRDEAGRTVYRGKLTYQGIRF